MKYRVLCLLLGSSNAYKLKQHTTDKGIFHDTEVEYRQDQKAWLDTQEITMADSENVVQDTIKEMQEQPLV